MVNEIINIKTNDIVIRYNDMIIIGFNNINIL
jgi:hypothetical protein